MSRLDDIREQDAIVFRPRRNTVTATQSQMDRHWLLGQYDAALALLRLLGADRECEPNRFESVRRWCVAHHYRPMDATRCEVGAAWDALGADHG